MNFSAPKTHPTVRGRLRPRLIGATVGVLVAVPFGAVTAFTPGDAPIPAAPAADDAWTVAGPAAVVLPASDVVVPSRPVVERVPVRLERVTASVAAAPASSTLPRSEPTRVRIPTIAVDSELVGLGLQADGRMEVPAGAFPAGWYTGAPTPGQLGPAILAGHVDYGGRAGVFSRLRELRPGDLVEVDRADGVVAVFRVTRVEQHDKDAFPTAAVYGDIDHAGLRLITCGGSFDRGARSYEDNIVVFAELDGPPAAARGGPSN